MAMIPEVVDEFLGSGSSTPMSGRPSWSEPGIGPSGSYAYSPDPPTYSDRILAPWAFTHPYLADAGNRFGYSKPTAHRLG